ncbi:CAP (Cysteine-rich secretory proteins Antigen 5 and Pathogenesis-related 1 protein) superfamily protein [Euphorbia peplus]|nr:CAP (Cysteine-rich secretory proteins Antigen 5 and Pathogenesis-related 1 protein) superfamily protein [Euphorbia peplus]
MGKSFILVVLVGLVSLALVLPSSHAQNSRKYYLAYHNKARADIGVPNLEWNGTLVSDAKAYLKSNVTHHCSLHVDLSSPGLNVQVGDFSLTISRAVKLWVAQKKYYDCATNSCVGGTCTAYTQVVWSNSSDVGCSIARCDNNQWMTAVACKYNPAGNIPGVRPH